MKISVFAGAMVLSALAFAQTPTKVGVINIQQALISTKEGQKAAADLEARTAPKQKELEKKQAEIQGMRDQLQKVSNTASEDAKRKMMGDIDARTKSFNRDVEDARTELEQEQGKVLNELGGKMMAVIDKYAKDNSFAVILDISSQQTPVIFASSAIDVTKDVVEMYDKNSGAAPAASGGAAAAKPAAPPAPKPAAPAAPKPAGAK